jgi:carbon monoxide dehydrogenase subunit G
MQLENKFTIDAPIDKAWQALNTPETVAPCFPGATLQEYEGDSFTGTVKVKLGPISLTYKGKGTYVERDEANHRVVIDASGRDVRGNGTASAKVTGTMVADGPNRTAVTMATDMTITGRPAQFGRGVISDVADKIIGQFSTCVAGKLAPKVSDKEGEAKVAPVAGPSPKPAAAAAGGRATSRAAR